MTWEQFSLLFLLVTVLVGTPGPANLSLLAYGAVVGPVRALPFLLGTLVGFQIALSLNALGLMGLLALFPQIEWALRVACILYITYLALKIARSKPPAVTAREPAHPRADFIRGIWLHPLNPKAHAMHIAVLGQVAGGTPTLTEFLIISVTFLIWGGILNFVWASGGAVMGQLAQTEWKYRTLSITLAGLMVASVAFSLLAVPH